MALHDVYLHEIELAAERGIRAADDRFLASHRFEDCKLCNAGPAMDFSMAFQPIVDVRAGRIVAFEGLVRGTDDEPAEWVLNHRLHNNRYSMDQRCREKAIAMAATLKLLDTGADLSINFYPNAVYEPKQCLKRTLNIADAVNFPLERIIFEVTEVEEVRDQDHLRNIMNEYQAQGLRVAIDDFGAGHSGLTLLSKFQPDIIKIDRALVTCLDERPASRAIVRSIVTICGDLGIAIIAEGIEREQEMRALCDMGITVMQGFYFARPGFEQLPVWP